MDMVRFNRTSFKNAIAFQPTRRSIQLLKHMNRQLRPKAQLADFKC